MGGYDYQQQYSGQSQSIWTSLFNAFKDLFNMNSDKNEDEEQIPF